jgi:hypothetical protein
MFNIENYTITLSRGDTASFTVTAKTDYEFAAEDRALFTVKDSAGEAILERVYALDTELGNGRFLVQLSNSDTDRLAVGAYTWDVRYVLHPYYDSTGRIIDGDQVITPKAAQALSLIATVGEV